MLNMEKLAADSQISRKKKRRVKSRKQSEKLNAAESTELHNTECHMSLKKNLVTEIAKSDKKHIVFSKYGVKKRPEPELVVYEPPVKKQVNTLNCNNVCFR